MLVYSLKTFPQLSYQASGSQAINNSNGTNVYQPIKGAFIIHTRSGGFQPTPTNIFDIPIGTYSSVFSHRYTNAEILMMNANTVSGAAGSVNTLARIFCSRSGTGAFSSTSFDSYSNGGPNTNYNDTWQSMLTYDNNTLTFKLRLVPTALPGGGTITNVGLYKGIFKIF